jgi:ABC-type uncharacterized transport system ATPase subunit
MIHKGRKVLDQPITQLKRQYDTSRVLFEPLAPQAGDAAALRGIPGVTELAGHDGEYELRLAPGSDPAAAIREAASRVLPARVEIARVRLEDMFVDIVKREPGAESAESLRQHLQGLGSEEVK